MEFKARFIGEAPRCIRKRRNRRYAELIDIRPPLPDRLPPSQRLASRHPSGSRRNAHRAVV